MGLSYQWRTTLTKLVEYGDEGIDKDAFCEMMGGSTDHILGQMFHSDDSNYWEHVPLTLRIRITDDGREALSDD